MKIQNVMQDIIQARTTGTDKLLSSYRNQIFPHLLTLDKHINIALGEATPNTQFLEVRAQYIPYINELFYKITRDLITNDTPQFRNGHLFRPPPEGEYGRLLNILEDFPESELTKELSKVDQKIAKVPHYKKFKSNNIDSSIHNLQVTKDLTELHTQAGELELPILRQKQANLKYAYGKTPYEEYELDFEKLKVHSRIFTLSEALLGEYRTMLVYFQWKIKNLMDVASFNKTNGLMSTTKQNPSKLKGLDLRYG